MIRRIFLLPMMNEQIKQGLIYAMRLLSVSKKSETRIREKLKEKGYPEPVAEEVIRELKEKNILDDSKFAEEKVYWATHGNPLGKRRLRFELKKQGLSEQVVGEALDGITRAEERENALALAKTQADKLKSLEPERRKKRLYDFLIRRGFDYEICRDVITKLEKQVEND